MNKFKLKALALGLFIPVPLFFGACSQDHSDPPPRPNSQKVLAQSDLEKMKVIPSNGPLKYDSAHKGLFTAIFGGTSGADVTNYFSTRIAYILSTSDKARLEISPHDFIYKAWLRSPDDMLPPIIFPKKLKSNELNSEPASAQIGAANIGTGLWLQSIVNTVTVTLVYGEERIPVNSSRAGIMILGPGYRETENTDGPPFTIPAEYRQAILLHEARHSDCSGGIKQNDLDVARSAIDLKNFTEKFQKLNCGHIHVFCPADHPYHGLPACDSLPFGAYAVGAIYSAAVAENLTSIDKQVMLANALDSSSRLLLDFNAMIDGKSGAPDMSSSGLSD